MPAKRTNLKGRRFGALKVIEFDAIRAKSAYWLCRCDCDKPACLGTLSVKATRLVRRLTEHCGALGYRRSSERHKTARAKVPPRTRRAIALKGGEAYAAQKQRVV